MWQSHLAGKAHRVCALSLVVMMSAGCSGQQEASKASPEPVTKDAKDTVFRETVGTMDKARAVEDTAAQHQQQLDQALENAEK